MLSVESCKTFFITGKLDETEGTSVGTEIENLLSAATIEEQLHILKDVSKFLNNVILKLSCTRIERNGLAWLKTGVWKFRGTRRGFKKGRHPVYFGEESAKQAACGQPVCFVLPTYIFCNSVSLCRMKGSYLILKD
jgi:hypothetical protein